MILIILLLLNSMKSVVVQARLGEVNQPIKQEDHAHALMQRSYPEGSTSRRYTCTNLANVDCLLFTRCMHALIPNCANCSSDQSGSPRANSVPDLPLVGFCTMYAYYMCSFNLQHCSNLRHVYFLC